MIIGRTERIKATVDELLRNGIIPDNGLFEITESMLDKYIEAYGKSGKTTNKKFVRSYARKLAGLELLRMNLVRGGTTSSVKKGMVYLISNPAWPQHLKIGVTTDVAKRLAAYQVYDPFQAYSVKNYEFVLDRRKTETILKRFGIHLESGEWIKVADSLKVINALRVENNI
jgi:hypothetical protein